MVYFNRKLKVKFSGDPKFLPQDMPEGKFLPVIGYTTQKRVQMIENVPKEKEDAFFFCIGITSGHIFRIAEFNCTVMIDEKAEMDILTKAVEMTGQLSHAIGNCNILLKYLSGQAADTDKAVKDAENGG
ncbi:MAG: hypothetical protein PHE88_12325 [Elusimicrobia bacterium]|nr:hypothetical protein [Elusimicrobiota bacterium]